MQPMSRAIAATFVTIVFVSMAGQKTDGGEWPQILGPQRNGIAEGEKLPDSWPAAGPREIWKAEVGSGFAGPIVAGGHVFLFHRVDDEEIIAAYDAGTGKPVWKKGFPTSYRASFNPDNGPRSVPLFHKGRIYLFGAAGDLHCVSAKDGKEIWARQALRDYRAREGYFGAGSTPIVIDDKLLVNVGSKKGAAVVAFALDDGKTVWKSFNDTASYSSPVVAKIDGVTHAIFVTRMNTISLDPRNGAIRFQFPFGRRGPTVNGANPIVIDDRLFVTSHYGVGAVLAKIGKESAQSVWANDESLSSHYATCIHHDGYLYGIHGQERATPLQFRCVELQSGKIMWSQDDVKNGTFILADGKILFMTLEGELVLVKPSSEQYVELARAKVCNPPARPLPALSGGKFYLRDARWLRCVDLAAGK